jgi:hypothetical protein
VSDSQTDPATGNVEEGKPALSEGLEDLSSLGVFRTQVSGALAESVYSATRGLYFEWNRVVSGQDGDPKKPPYLMCQFDRSQGEAVFLKTPAGIFVTAAPSIALHLQPRVIQNFGSRPREEEPRWVSEMRSGVLAQDGGVDILLVEYCLEAHRDYWAEVETRYECLPPQPPSSEPLYQPYFRLRLSDRPFSVSEELGWPTMGTAPLP